MKYMFIICYLFAHLCLGKDLPKYPVADIPEELKKDMYAVIREREVKYEILSRKSSGYYIRKAITIFNAKAKSAAFLTVAYDKNTSINTFKGSVYDKDGNLIKKLKSSEIKDEGAISSISLFEDTRIKYADLSVESYPYTVEYEFYIHKNFLYAFPDFILTDDDEIAVQQSKFEIVFPKELEPRFKTINITEPANKSQVSGKESVAWIFLNHRPQKFEPLSNPETQLKKILVAPNEFEYAGYVGNMESWKDYGEWQELLNKGRDVLSPHTVQQMKEMVAGLNSVEEKTKTIYEFMQNKTRYVSIQLGIGGLQPFESALVDKTGYGDCKALSNYMVSLLKAVGIKAYYTTIMAGKNAPAVIPDFPSDQSNHIIVAVPTDQDTLWLECTSQTNPFGYLGSFTDDRYALMITENGGQLVKTPSYSKDQNLQIRNAEVIIDVAGKGLGKVQTTYTGLQYENGNLNFILDNQYDKQKEWIQDNTNIPSFDLVDFTIKNQKSKIPSATVELKLTLNRLASVSGKRLFLTPNLMNRSSYVPPKVENRKTNVVRKFAYSDIDTIRYKMPEGIYPEFLPEPVQLKSIFGEYESSVTIDRGDVIYVRKVKMEKGIFPPESYNDLIEFYKSINKADNAKLVFLSKT